MFSVLVPSLAFAEWSANWDKPLTKEQQIKIGMKLTSAINLHPGVNNITFYGLGAEGNGKTVSLSFVPQDNHDPLYEGYLDTDVPISELGKITVIRDNSASGCSVEVFLPSAEDSATQTWALMPLGSIAYPLPGWSSYSNKLNCSDQGLKAMKFYQGTLEGVPTTFLISATQYGVLTPWTGSAVYNIQVLVFATAQADDPPPYFGLYGQYTTSVRYKNPAVALSSEFTLPNPN